MLPRSASYKIYWLGRYLERLESTARILDAEYYQLLEGQPDPAREDQKWEGVLRALGLYENFFRRYGHLSAHNVVDFIAFCPDNPGSMLNTISRAREDGNGTLPNSIFIELNKLYLKIKESDTKTVLQKLGLHEFLTEIINANLLLCGMIDKHWVY